MLLRNLHLIGAIQSDEIRIDTYEGREHTVVPVIAIMEGVVWPGNAPTPEFVPASVLEFAPAGWNGKPVMMGHPAVDGEHVSANSPEVHALSKIGTIFNTHMLGKKLRMEAWLDNERIATLGGDAVTTLAKVTSKEVIEVSVGAFIKLLNKTGAYNGKQFSGQWDEVVPDHLALLPEGEIGACSVAMGCGTPRVASHRVLATEFSFEPSDPTEERSMAAIEKTKDFMHGLFEAMRSDRVKNLLAAEDLSDRELRDKLSKALQATVPGFMGVLEVVPGDKTVTFETWTEDWKIFTQSFSMNDGGEVKLKGAAAEVQPVTRFEPIVAIGNPEQRNASECGCAALRENSMKTKTERIEALITSKKTTLPKTFLETCSDQQIDDLEKLPEPTAEVPAAVVAPVPAAAPVPEPATLAAKKPITIDDLPPELRSLVDSAKKIDTRVRQNLLTALAATKQTVYSAEELGAMSTEQLEKVAQLAKAEVPEPTVDFSLNNGVTRAASANDTVPAPKPAFGGRFAKKTSAA